MRSQGNVDATSWSHRARSGSLLSTPVTVVILSVISIGVTLVFWPGHMDGDAIGQITQARQGFFLDWWAPVLDGMWRLLFLMHLSPGFVLLASTTVFVFSVFELLRTVLTRRLALVMTLLIVVFPPVLGFLGALQRETWFGASALAAYALLARVRRDATQRPKLLAGLALLAGWFAMAARQNAVIALLPAVVLALHILLPMSWRVSARAAAGLSAMLTRAARMVAGTILTVLVFLGSQWVITYPILGASRTYPQQVIYFLDLSNLSLRKGEVLIPAFAFPSQDLSVLASKGSRYSALPLLVQGGPLKRNPKAVFPSVVTKAEYPKLQHAWLSAIMHHPWAYLSERAVVFGHLIGWHSSAYAPYNPGFADNPWGYDALIPAANTAAMNYLGHFTVAPLEGGKLFHVWTYMVLCFVVSIDLLRRTRRSLLRLIGIMSGFALLYYVAYFFIAPAPDYRYAWYLIGATVVATIIDLAAHVETVLATRRTRYDRPPKRGVSQGPPRLPAREFLSPDPDRLRAELEGSEVAAPER